MQTWKTFVSNHMEGIASIDLGVVRTIAFQQLFAFLVLGHERRLLVSIGLKAITIIRPETLVRWHRAGFPSVLAVEISLAGRPPQDRCGTSRADPTDERELRTHQSLDEDAPSRAGSSGPAERVPGYNGRPQASK